MEKEICETFKPNPVAVDSDYADEWQGYFADSEDEVLDDEALPPIALKEELYSGGVNAISCSICQDKLDKEIGSPDGCAHLFCLKCISSWAEKRKTCPVDRKKFDQVLKFVKRKGKIIYQPTKGAKISCGKLDLHTQNSECVQSSEESSIPQNEQVLINSHNIVENPTRTRRRIFRNYNLSTNQSFRQQRQSEGISEPQMSRSSPPNSLPLINRAQTASIRRMLNQLISERNRRRFNGFTQEAVRQRLNEGTLVRTLLNREWTGQPANYGIPQTLRRHTIYNMSSHSIDLTEVIYEPYDQFTRRPRVRNNEEQSVVFLCILTSLFFSQWIQDCVDRRIRRNRYN